MSMKRSPEYPRVPRSGPLTAGFLNLEALGHRTLGANLRGAFEKLGPEMGMRVVSRGTHLWNDRGNWEKLESSTYLPRSTHNLLSLLRAGVRGRQDMIELARTEDCHVLIVNTQNVAAFAGGLMKRLPTILISDATPLQIHTLSAYDAPTNKRPIEDLKHRINVRNYAAATAVIAWSHWNKQSMVHDYHVPSDNVHVIPPGIELQKWRPNAVKAANTRLRLLFVGGDFVRKGGRDLLEVFGSAGLNETAEVHIVTKDVSIRRVEGVYTYTDLDSNDPRLIELYRSADVFVLPTYADTFSIASLEAMAAGLPVIATDVGGIADIVEHGVTGFLLKPGDKNGLVDALKYLISNHDARVQFGLEARKRVEKNFDNQKNARRILELTADIARRTQASTITV